MTSDECGRLLIIGFDQSAWDDELGKLLEEIQPGGVIFFNRNTAGGQAGFRELVARVREALGRPSFLAADVEGGAVDRLREVLAPFPSARTAAEAHDDPLLRRFGALVGEALRAFGLNTNLAPVLDLASPVLGTRAAGDKPAEVLRFARNFLEGLSQQGLLGCGKHFPGLGGGGVDTHAELAVIEKSAEKLWEEDLLPFRELAAALPLMMVGHAAYPALEEEGTPARPATLSPAIATGLLREKVGFRGLAVSDDLEMGGVLGGRSMGEAAVSAVEAGCQLLLVCHGAQNIRAARRALAERAESDSTFAPRVAAAVEAVESFSTRRLAGASTSDGDLADLRRRIEHFRKTVEGMEAMHLVPLGASGAAPPRRGGPRGGRHGGRGGRRREGGRGERDRGPRGPRRGESGPRGPRREEDAPRGPRREEDGPRGPRREGDGPRGPRTGPRGGPPRRFE